jgi:hypothetical protein
MSDIWEFILTCIIVIIHQYINLLKGLLILIVGTILRQ